jgi:hypothetical protein
VSRSATAALLAVVLSKIWSGTEAQLKALVDLEGRRAQVVRDYAAINATITTP